MAAPMIGVFLPTMTERDETPIDIVAAARHAEDLGFESAWTVGQLIAGTGVPFVDSTVALSAAAGATSSIRLAYRVMILPLRTADVGRQTGRLAAAHLRTAAPAGYRCRR